MADSTAVARTDDIPDIIRLALDKNLAPEQLEKMLGMVERMDARAERHEDKKAELSYAEAFLSFQSEVPAINKIRSVKGKLKFSYAGHDDVMKVIQPYLTKNNLSLSYSTKESQRPDSLTIVCRVRHGSYYEDTEFVCPVPKELTVTGTQKAGAALQYAKRYATGAALNLTFADEDDETKLLSNTQEDTDAEIIINEDQVKELEKLIKSAGSDTTVVLSHYQVKSLTEMNEPSYRHLKEILEQRVKGKK